MHFANQKFAEELYL